MKTRPSTTSAPRLPRVLHALAPGAAGGLESVVQLLASGWVARGGEVSLCLSLDTGTEPPSALVSLREQGVEVVCHALPPRAYLQERRLIMATCTQFAPDVVHTHGYRADLLAGSAAHRLGLARVSTLHGFTGGDWKNRLYERLQLRQLRHFDAVVSVSEPIAGRLSVLGFSPERVAIVPNAFSQLRAPFSRAEARALLGLPPDKAIVGWVGRLSHEKGADVLLEAMARLHRPDVLTVVVGDGRLRGTLEAQARSLGMMEQVRWPGLVEDAGRCMAAFDAFVLSSRTEGTPIALLEAMASGTPIVATAVGGVPQVVVAGSEALLTPAEDPGALAAAIGEVLDNREAAAQRARAARARLERDFALDPWIERHRTLYQRILARRRGENA